MEMDIFGFRLEWVGGKPLGNLRETQGHIIDLEKRVDRLEKHGTKMAGKALKKEAMDGEIAEVLAGSNAVIETPGDPWQLGEIPDGD